MLDELLTTAELAQWLKLEPAGVQSLCKRGHLKKNVHWFNPPGLGKRFSRGAIEQWLRQQQEPAPVVADVIPMARGYNLTRRASIT